MVKLNARTALVAASAIATLSAPLWLRVVPFFEVRRVEIEGARYVSAEAIVRSLEVDSGFNVFSALGPLKERVLRMPGVSAAELTRKLPATLHMAVTERVPVAMVPGPAGMIALDVNARPLPYDPALVTIDVPVVGGSDRGITAVIGMIRSLDVEMFDDVIAATRNGSNDIELQFEEQSVRLAAVPTIREILKVAAVRHYMIESGTTFSRLDARFGGQVVAQRSGV